MSTIKTVAAAGAVADALGVVLELTLRLQQASLVIQRAQAAGEDIPQDAWDALNVDATAARLRLQQAIDEAE